MSLVNDKQLKIKEIVSLVSLFLILKRFCKRVYIEVTGKRLTRLTRLTFSCPLDPLDNTALETSVLQNSQQRAIGNLTTGADDGARLSSSEELSGESRGRAE